MSKEKVNRAGIIPYYIDPSTSEIFMLFMQPSDSKFGGFFFQLAKGRIEEGETELEAALREGGEELGLFQGNIDGTVHKLGKFLGRTTVYVAKIKDPNMFGDPHFETKETKWLTLDQFLSEGRELHRPLVKAAVRLIKDKENIK